MCRWFSASEYFELKNGVLGEGGAMVKNGLSFLMGVYVAQSSIVCSSTWAACTEKGYR